MIRTVPMINKIGEWYKRMRHSRGFGVHSPSAYRLIREVLRPSPRYAYYAYSNLKSLADPTHTLHELSLIYRLLVDIRPSAVMIVGDEKSPLAAVVRLALPSAEINPTNKSPQFAIIDKDTKNKPSITISSANHIYFCDTASPLLPGIISQMTFGHIFKSPRHTLIVCRNDLPLQTITLNF